MLSSGRQLAPGEAIRSLSVPPRRRSHRADPDSPNLTYQEQFNPLKFRVKYQHPFNRVCSVASAHQKLEPPR